MIRYLLVLLLGCSAWGQAFTQQDLPFLAQQSLTTASPQPVLVYSALEGVKTKTGSLVNNDFVIAWTNTAPGGSHTYDLLSLTNSKPWTPGTSTNPIYRATWNASGGPLIDISSTSNGVSFATIGSSNCPSIGQPYVTFLVFLTKDVSSASAPFDHAIWSSTGDNDHGDQGMQDISTPPWKMNNINDCAGGNLIGPPLAANTWYVYTMVWNAASSFARTNGVDYVAGTGPSALFGCGNYGFDFGMSTGTTPYYIGYFSAYSGPLTTNQIQSIETSLRGQFGF